MKPSYAPFAGLLAAGLLTMATPAVPAAAATAPEVVTTDSGALRGATGDGVRAFQGIPYAAPPVGDLRWTSPRPAAAWTGVRDATEPGPACAQPTGYPIGVPSETEDCLYLNVTTPAKVKAGKAGLPVVVWIHGGSLMYGTGDMYGPSRLASAGAVVVSMNYRLGVMGFLASPALGGSGGFGLEDQQAALRWVRANIGAFGGDPGNVTIMGQSGGGFAVCGHLTSPASKGLFHRAIVQSAPCATGGSRTRAEAETESAALIKKVACDDADDVAACLRGVPAAKLLAAYGAFVEPRPVAGTELLPRTPAQALRTGRFNRVPVLIGVNHDEERGMIAGQELAPGGRPIRAKEYEPTIGEEFDADAGAVLARYPLRKFGSAGEALATVRTDRTWAVPTLDTARLLSRWTPTRMYEFAEKDTPWFAGYPATSFPVRAQHMAELPYLFDLKLFDKLPPRQARLAERMIGAWVRFAGTGDPGWQRFAERDRYVRSLTAGTWQRAAFEHDHAYAFWKKLAR